MKHRIFPVLVALLLLLSVGFSFAQAEQPDGSYRYSGTGATIIKDYKTPPGICRLTFKWPYPGENRVFYMDGASEILLFRTYDYTPSQYLVYGMVNDIGPKLFVESQTSWNLTVVPMQEVDSCDFTGKGPYATDYFAIQDDMIVSISLIPRKESYVKIHAYAVDSLTFTDDDIYNIYLDTISAPVKIDYIIPCKNAGDFVFFNIDGPEDLSWTIKAK